jgi:hypothetical protein
MMPRKVEPHGLKPVALRILQRAEPSEAYPTTLLQSFEGYPLRIHPRSENPCLHAEVLPVGRQALRHAGVAFCVGGQKLKRKPPIFGIHTSYLLVIGMGIFKNPCNFREL